MVEVVVAKVDDNIANFQGQYVGHKIWDRTLGIPDESHQKGRDSAGKHYVILRPHNEDTHKQTSYLFQINSAANKTNQRRIFQPFRTDNPSFKVKIHTM